MMEKLTGAKVKDCFKDDQGTIYFVVAQGQLGKAIGKKGVIIKKIQENLKKKIKVIEFRKDPKQFFMNIIYPLKVEGIKQEENYLIVEEPNKKTKSLLIGRNGRNLNLMNRAIKRFFDVEIKII